MRAERRKRIFLSLATPAKNSQHGSFLLPNNSEWRGGVSLCVSVIPQIRDVNILILSLKNGSNIVHSAEPVLIARIGNTFLSCLPASEGEYKVEIINQYENIY